MVLILHVFISLVALGAGFPWLSGLLRNQPSQGVHRLFISTTLLTSLTGFLFPFDGVKPGHVFAVLTLVLLAAALRGGRKMYVVGGLASLYLNWVVFFVQLYQKTPALQPLAATQAGLQLALLIAFVSAGRVLTNRSSSSALASD
ncbi:hypothetical protein JST97_36800 [bacterium]|nr:hypothetical protein [bacterium]